MDRPIKPQHVLDELIDISRSLDLLIRADLSALFADEQKRKLAKLSIGEIEYRLARLRTRLA